MRETIGDLPHGVGGLKEVRRIAAEYEGGNRIVYGRFGFFTATGLGLFLARARSKASLEDVSVAWSALIGAAAGAVFPLMFNILMLQSLVPLRLIGGFLPLFVLSGGSLKQVGKHMNLSYPTVRNRLDKVIANIHQLDEDK